MSETVYTIERDLKEAKAMADGLIPYVYKDRLYGNAKGGGLFAASNMPSLTIGALLMRLRRLNAMAGQLTAAQRATLEQIEAQTTGVRKEWTQHYTDKLTQEAASRLKAMDQFFGECEDDPRLCANAYLPEALRRTVVQDILEALAMQNQDTSELTKAAKKTDSRLRRFVEPAPFIWAKALEPYYPPLTYWWLYARPPQPGAKKDE